MSKTTRQFDATVHSARKVSVMPRVLASRRSLLAAAVLSLFAAGPAVAASGIISGMTLNDLAGSSATLDLVSDDTYASGPGVLIDGDNGLVQVLGDVSLAGGGVVRIDGANGNILFSHDAGTTTTTISSQNSNIAGGLAVEGGLVVTTVDPITSRGLVVSAGGAEITGDSLITGGLETTGSTTLNSGGDHTITADGSSARLESGSNSVAVNDDGVNITSTVTSDTTITSSITMGNPGGSLPGGVAINASGAANDTALQASVTVTAGTNTHGLVVYADRTTLSGGTTTTEITLSDNGFFVNDLAGTGQTFSVTNTAQARIGNNGQAGSLSIANGSGGNHTVLNGTTNSITGTTSTALTGGSTTLTLNNSGASLGGAQLHNVAAGTAGTDAVNVNQLNDAVSGISGDVNRLSERAYGGIAAVAALAAIPAPADGKRHSIGAGVGTYGGENALAFGYRGAINENVSVTMGLSHNSASKTAANAGVGFSW